MAALLSLDYSDWWSKLWSLLTEVVGKGFSFFLSPLIICYRLCFGNRSRSPWWPSNAPMFCLSATFFGVFSYFSSAFNLIGGNNSLNYLKNSSLHSDLTFIYSFQYSASTFSSDKSMCKLFYSSSNLQKWILVKCGAFIKVANLVLILLSQST